MSDEEIIAFLNDWLNNSLFTHTNKKIAVQELIKRYIQSKLTIGRIQGIIKKQQKEIEEKTTILFAGAEKVKQLEKEIEELQIIADDIKGHNIVYIDTPEFEEKFISKDKIREKIQDLKETISRMDIEDIGRMLREEQILILEEILEENNND